MNFRRLFKQKKRNHSLPVLQFRFNHVQELKEEDIHKLFSSSADVKINVFSLHGKHRVLMVYCEGLVESKQINEIILPRLDEAFLAEKVSHPADLMHQSMLQLQYVQRDTPVEEFIMRVFSGELFLFFHGDQVIYALDISSPPQRNPEDSKTDISVRGARDCFTEEIEVNVALIRKRLRTNQLCYERFVAGKHSKKKIGLLYVQDIAEERMVKEVVDRLNGIKEVDIFTSTQVEQLITDSGFSLFPLFTYTGRPDFAANTLLHGRFVILVDGVPTVTIAPVNFTYLLNTPEDMNSSVVFVGFERMIRLAGFMLSLFLPGFWIALITYHQDQLPYTLVATLVLSRQGVPFPTALECLLMLFLFEIFREAGARLPLPIGQTLSVVGGLIVGDAAISAGLTAPGILVIVAISVLSTFTLINQDLVSTVGILRILIVILSSLLGLFGFLACLLGVLIYLANLRSFGVPYLSPLSPPVFQDIYKVFISVPWKRVDSQPQILKTGKNKKEGE